MAGLVDFLCQIVFSMRSSTEEAYLRIVGEGVFIFSRHTSASIPSGRRSIRVHPSCNNRDELSGIRLGMVHQKSGLDC